MKYHVLFNPLANNGRAGNESKNLSKYYNAENIVWRDITQIRDYDIFFREIDRDDAVILCGGDGTLNRFVNAIQDIRYENEIYYFACGSGNDFLKDLNRKKNSGPVDIRPFIKHLPVVTVKGERRLFLNNVSFGIDGYCTMEGDRQKEKSNKKINYTAIALKGLLFDYKPVNAKVTVDGVQKEYKHVWLSPTMNGRYFGGGMMAAPQQDRTNPEHTVSLLVFSGTGKLQTLMIFPQIFKGTHISNKHCDVIKGHNIMVEFDSARAVQIDGETIKDVLSYHVQTAE